MNTIGSATIKSLIAWALLLSVVSGTATAAKHKHHAKPASTGGRAAEAGNAKTPDAKSDTAEADDDKATDAKGEDAEKPAVARHFAVYRHFRPDGDPAEFVTYEDVQAARKSLGLLPLVLAYNTDNKESCEAQVKKYVDQYDNCPIVFDIEKNVDPRHMTEIIRWAHEAAPGCKVGHYTMPNKGLVPCGGVAGVVDAFYPSMYVNYKTTWGAWESRARKLVAQGHQQRKPVYLFLWPMYHGGKHRLPANFWKFQLETARKVGADGVVIWGARKSTSGEKEPWWRETKKFLEELKKAEAAPPTP